MNNQPRRNDHPAHPPQCPICHHPQTKIQRRLSDTTRGAIAYVCTRAEQCSIGRNLREMDTWAAV
jgi:hypothetical protein